MVLLAASVATALWAVLDSRVAMSARCVRVASVGRSRQPALRALVLLPRSNSAIGAAGRRDRVVRASHALVGLCRGDCGARRVDRVPLGCGLCGGHRDASEKRGVCASDRSGRVRTHSGRATHPPCARGGAVGDEAALPGIGRRVRVRSVLLCGRDAVRHLDVDMWLARGVANALVIPVHCARHGAQYGVDDRHARLTVTVFHSTALVVSGLFLLAIAAAGYIVRFFGGELGTAMQIAVLLRGAADRVLLLVSSGSFRSKLRVFVSKHFFSYRYDYRDEWLRFTRTLSTDSTVQSVEERCIKALADLVESPAGVLWLRAGRRPLCAEQPMECAGTGECNGADRRGRCRASCCKADGSSTSRSTPSTLSATAGSSFPPGSRRCHRPGSSYRSYPATNW